MPDYSKNPFNVHFLNADANHWTEPAPTVCFAEAAWDAAIETVLKELHTPPHDIDGNPHATAEVIARVQALRSMKQREGGK